MQTDIKKAFGSCVRRYRLEAGFSQEKFALAIGMDRTYLASVESGRRNISIENIKKISSGLNLPLATLFQAVDSVEKE